MDYAGVHGYDLVLGICVLIAINLAFRLGAFVCLEIHTFRHLNKIYSVFNKQFLIPA